MVVLTGRVKISNYSADGKEAILNFFAPDRVFGEIALLDGKPRTADATAMEPTELFVLRRQELLRFVEGHPQVAIGLIEGLCAKLRHTTLVVEDIMFLGRGPTDRARPVAFGRGAWSQAWQRHSLGLQAPPG